MAGGDLQFPINDHTPACDATNRLLLPQAPLPRLSSHWYLLDDLNPVRVQPDDLARMISQQADGMQPQVRQDLRADAILVLQRFLAVGRRIALVITEARSGLM